MLVQASGILISHSVLKRRRNLYNVCITLSHTCNYFTRHRHRGNGLERQCVRGEAWTVCLLNLSWGLWEHWNENSGLLLLRRCFIENTPTCHPREDAGGEEYGRSLNHFVWVWVRQLSFFFFACYTENKSPRPLHLIIPYDDYWNCHFLTLESVVVNNLYRSSHLSLSLL